MTLRAIYWDDSLGCFISERGNVTPEKVQWHKKTQAWGFCLKEAMLIQSPKTPELQHC